MEVDTELPACSAGGAVTLSLDEYDITESGDIPHAVYVGAEHLLRKGDVKDVSAFRNALVGQQGIQWQSALGKEWASTLETQVNERTCTDVRVLDVIQALYKLRTRIVKRVKPDTDIAICTNDSIAVYNRPPSESSSAFIVNILQHPQGDCFSALLPKHTVVSRFDAKAQDMFIPTTKEELRCVITQVKGMQALNYHPLIVIAVSEKPTPARNRSRHSKASKRNLLPEHYVLENQINTLISGKATPGNIVLKRVLERPNEGVDYDGKKWKVKPCKFDWKRICSNSSGSKEDTVRVSKDAMKMLKDLYVQRFEIGETSTNFSYLKIININQLDSLVNVLIYKSTEREWMCTRFNEVLECLKELYSTKFSEDNVQMVNLKSNDEHYVKIEKDFAAKNEVDLNLQQKREDVKKAIKNIETFNLDSLFKAMCDESESDDEEVEEIELLDSLEDSPFVASGKEDDSAAGELYRELPKIINEVLEQFKEEYVRFRTKFVDGLRENAQATESTAVSNFASFKRLLKGL